ncbi:MAG TPA: ribosomal protein S18-alanine N-acetyltransferase [Pyrinomonadaceae bacterium]|nr:ribosomal protein S18-alanine N-acetyltransferase [Pyrinomonadaceae bacterium]
MSRAEQQSAENEFDVAIVRMSEHDLLEVVEIEETSGLSRWGWAAYYAELQGGNRDLLLVAKPAVPRGIEQHQVVGYIVARQTAGELHINNVAVRDQFRRRGYGSLLLGRVLDEARKKSATTAFLEVRSGNTSAQALYSKCGFRAIATRPNYYTDPREDAVVMSLNLRSN